MTRTFIVLAALRAPVLRGPPAAWFLIGRGTRVRVSACGELEALVDWRFFTSKFFFNRFPRAKALLDVTPFVPAVAVLEDCESMVRAASQLPEYAKTAAQGYQGFLGVHNSWKAKMNLSATQLVEVVNRWIGTLGSEPPMLQAKTLGKMQLRGTPGLREEPKGMRDGGGGGGGRSGGRGGGGGGGGGRGGDVR